MMNSVLFLDLEITAKGKIADVGLILGEETLHTSSITKVATFITSHKEKISLVCGHNILEFDDLFLEQTKLQPLLEDIPRLDTLPVSLLFFNEKTFHKLPKKYKSDDNFQNNPLEDAKLTKTLLEKSIRRFLDLETLLQNILYTLTHQEECFGSFYTLLETTPATFTTEILEKTLLRLYFPTLHKKEILQDTITNHPMELAYIIALMTPVIEIKAHPPKILYTYPHIVTLQKQLTLKEHDLSEAITNFSEEVFGFASFREFPRLNPSLTKGSLLSQKEIVQAGIAEESFLAVLPTGGGKTFSFWLPALYRSSKIKALSVIISPLQALMQDHMASFAKQVANFKAVAISSYLTPLERADAIEQIIHGEADILYIAPESLRSNMIFSILKNRVIDRFIIDEAHCLSTWGHDFRHDYFYIAEFIKDLLQEQPWQEHIPVSCFTATAKQDVINDISQYFQKNLSITLQHYLAKPERKNLTYQSILIQSKEEKYTKLLEILNTQETPALIYIPSSTKECDNIAQKLSLDIAPKVARSFHSKLPSEEKQEILQEFIKNNIDIVVATTAFGMGVDKPDIKTVIHYEISDSLENYAQEAGRGARDASLQAICPILFDENDLEKHFATLNRTKLSSAEINAIFRVLKHQKSNKILLSSQEIADYAGWDTQGSDDSWDIKVKTALLELEREGYLERKRNQVRYFANAVAKDHFQKLHTLLAENTITQEEHQLLITVLKTILGIGKPSTWKLDEASLVTGIEKEKIATAIAKLKQFNIINDGNDITLTLKRHAKSSFEKIKKIEYTLIELLEPSNEQTTTIRALNETLIDQGVIKEDENHAQLIKTLLRTWQKKQEYFSFYRVDRQNDLWRYQIKEKEKLLHAIAIKHTVCDHLLSIFIQDAPQQNKNSFLEYSIVDLHNDTHNSIPVINKALLILHQLKIIELGEGRFLYYAPLQIHKTQKFHNKVRYTKEEYKKRLQNYYDRKVESIHIIGEYAKKLKNTPQEAMMFLNDYFTLPYMSFKRRYKLLKEEITRPMTKRRYEKIFHSLSSTQQKIVLDNQHNAILTLAGPGSGKTKVLVHKIASLLLQEDIKPDQFLMLTFSHSAVSEFKQRLYELIGSIAFDVDIYTFHSYALKLTSREVQDEELLKNVIHLATQQIKEEHIIPPFKSVIVLDEYQDINQEAFAFVVALYHNQNATRIIAVGDDDQMILRFNGADISYFHSFSTQFPSDKEEFIQYQLLENYRSSREIITVCDQIRAQLPNRLKTNPIEAINKESGIPVVLYTTKQHNLEAIAVALSKEKLTKNESVAYLAFTNQEVTTLFSQLYANGIFAHYLIDQSQIKLKNLAEIYNFTKRLEALSKNNSYFDKKILQQALQESETFFHGSTHLLLLKKVVKKFQKEYNHYYISIFKNYLDELTPDEFLDTKHAIVTTMHKSKGKEFDHIVLTIQEHMLDEDWLRLLYVAMTRAKKKLTIVTNAIELPSLLETANTIEPNTIEILPLHTKYQNANLVVLIMDLRDVVLGISYWDGLDTKPQAGMRCSLEQENGNFYLTYQAKKIERLSKKMAQKLQHYFETGWSVQNIIIENIIYWHNKEKEVHSPQVLGRITLEKIRVP